jgi:hypothetical protein
VRLDVALEVTETHAEFVGGFLAGEQKALSGKRSAHCDESGKLLQERREIAWTFSCARRAFHRSIAYKTLKSAGWSPYWTESGYGPLLPLCCSRAPPRR